MIISWIGESVRAPRPLLYVYFVFLRMSSVGEGTLTAKYGKIGGKLNQIARIFNECYHLYPTLAKLFFQMNKYIIQNSIKKLCGLSFPLVFDFYHI